MVGRPFVCFRHWLGFPLRSIKNCLFDNSFLKRRVSFKYPVISNSLSMRILRLTVSDAAERPTNTAPVISPFPNSSDHQMNCVMFSSWLVHDFPSLKPGCFWNEPDSLRLGFQRACRYGWGGSLKSSSWIDSLKIVINNVCWLPISHFNEILTWRFHSDVKQRLILYNNFIPNFKKRWWMYLPTCSLCQRSSQFNFWRYSSDKIEVRETRLSMFEIQIQLIFSPHQLFLEPHHSRWPEVIALLTKNLWNGSRVGWEQ